MLHEEFSRRRCVSEIGPAPEEVVVDAGELHGRGMIGHVDMRPAEWRVSRSNSSVRSPSSRTML